MTNALWLGVACVAVWMVARRLPARSTCSASWIRQQIRARGLTGYSGSYHEDR